MRNRLFRGCLAVLVICVLLWTALPGLADFGDFSGDSDYGGYDSDWGSDYDSDWGSDYDSDWGSDYDSDWSSGYSSGSYYSSGSSDLSWEEFLGVAVVIAVIVLVIALKRKKAMSSRNRQVRIPQQQKPSNLRPIQEYNALDPNFDPEALRTKLSNLYVQMQQCWTAKDLTSLRPYFTDAYYAQMDRQLDALRQQKQTNYVERISVLGVTLDGFTQAAGMDRIIATVNARITDYTVSDETGEVVKGDRRLEKFMTYEYTLIRPTGAMSAEQGGLQTVNCPNCGAPLNLNATAQCPYCGSVVTVDANDFMISAIRGVSQRTL